MAVGDAHVFPGFLIPVLTQISFQSHWLLFLHASAEVRVENTPERNIASTGSQPHNHQVMSPARSPLSHPGGALSPGKEYRVKARDNLWYINTQIIEMSVGSFLSIVYLLAE